ncbi:unnamed protein product [Dicrocoelium dendriticum]|nr:unnamed protein product [Dicrocoelium dendriticum]
MPENNVHFLAGSLSGFMVRALTQPFDVIKIRFQLQVEPIKPTSLSYYSSFTQALSRIVKEEGFTGLWKGHVPGQLLSMCFCGFEFAVFYALTALSENHSLSLTSPVGRELAFGAAAGTIAAAFSQPLDVMRTRLAAQGRNKVYSGLLKGTSCLIREEGVLALWRGLGPSCILVAPQTAVTFAMYEYLRRVYVTHLSLNRSPDNPNSNELPRIVSLLSGSISGLAAKTTVYPLDLIKKRLAIRGFEEARKSFGTLPKHYTSASYKLSSSVRRADRVDTQLYATWACFRGIVAHEGIVGLFKGWTPSAMKAMLSTGLTFFFYEQFCHVFRHILG